MNVILWTVDSRQFRERSYIKNKSVRYCQKSNPYFSAPQLEMFEVFDKEEIHLMKVTRHEFIELIVRKEQRAFCFNFSTWYDSTF